MPTLSLDPPIVMIASAGSGGSHLAAVLLARREPFFTGPEANLASRPDLFDRECFKIALFKGLLRQEPYFRPVERRDGIDFHLVPLPVLTNEESYGIETAAAKFNLLSDAAGWPAMIRYLHRQLAETGAIREHDVLVEHSPSCSASLTAAFAEIPGLKVAHLVRDPRDSIALMMARRRVLPHFSSLTPDESLSLSARQWAFLTASALRVSDQKGYIRITYEELVRRPEEVTDQLLRHFGFPDAALRADGPLLIGPMLQQAGWTSSPTGPVTERSVGRFKQDLSASQLRKLESMSFTFTELNEEVSMRDMIERFGASG